MKDKYLIGYEQADNSKIYITGIGINGVNTTYEFYNAWDLGTEEDAVNILNYIKKNIVGYSDLKIIEIKLQERIITHEVAIELPEDENVEFITHEEDLKEKEKQTKKVKPKEEKIVQVVPEEETFVEIEE